jgi:hypothetical protein
MDAYLQKLQEIGDKLASGQLTPEQAASQLSSQNNPLPSDDEIQNIGKRLEDSIKPETLILSDDEINDLICTYQGEELANRMLWEILNKQGYTRTIKEKPGFTKNTTFDKFIADKNLSDKLKRAKEMLSDNLDIDFLGIKFKGANLKEREISIGPFAFPIHVITSRGTPLFYHIPAPKLSLDKILDKLRKKAKTPKQCVKDYNKKYNSNSAIDDNDIIKKIEKLAEKEAKDKSRNSTSSNTPKDIYDIVDDIFCEPDIPINPETGEPLFTKEDLTSFLEDICKPDIETQNPEVNVDTSNVDTAEVADAVNQCLGQAKGIFKDVRSNNELKLRYEKAEKDLEEILYHYRVIQNYYNELYKSYLKKLDLGDKLAKKLNYRFEDVVSSLRNYDYKFNGSAIWEGITQGIRDNVKRESSKINYNPDSLHLTINAVLGSKEGTTALDEIRKFSCRLKETTGYVATSQTNSSPTAFNYKFLGYFGIKFTLQYPHSLGEILPYNEINIDIPNSVFSEKYQTIDISKLKVGMEFAANGVLGGKKNDFLKTYNDFIIEKNENPIINSPFYDFIRLINDTNLTKQEIIDIIERDHGFLYSTLYELSSNSWLFFTAEERGDNDARSMKDLKPQKTIAGVPNKSFTDFWGGYKKAWNRKYISQKDEIEKRITKIKGFTDAFVDRLSDYYFLINTSTVKDNTKLLKDASDGIDERVNQIQDLLLYIAQRVKELDQQNSPEVLSNRAGQIKCGVKPQTQAVSLQCPSDCCGPSGEAIDIGGFGGSTNSPDCPSIFTVCYWKEFCKKLNIVGTLPIPNGLPPIEKPGDFLPNLALKYWPVGYIPPAIIPIPPPAVNPLDGMPFIRIPMPFDWTVVDPIIIPLPIGLIVIFIPFIGGFMPSPLVFFHDYLTGNSIFLAGMRGFRFIPRKSDPITKDPLEDFKKTASKGIPHFSFPFPNLGGDNVDSADRMQKDITENLLKQLANTSKNVDFSKIQKLQDQIATKKKELGDKILSIKRKAALTGESAKKEEAELAAYIKSVESQKIDAVKNAIKDFVNKAVDVPDIQFPKKSYNLIAEIPSVAKLSKNIADKIKIGTIPKITSVNLKSKILSKLKSIDLPEDPNFLDKNKNLSPDSKIVASFDVPINEIGKNKDAFDKLSGLISGGIGNFLNGDDSPIKPKSLGLFTTKLNAIPKGGNQIPAPSSLTEIPNPILSSLGDHIANNLSVSGKDITSLANRASIGNNKVLRDKDLKLMMKSTLNKTLKSFPGDLKNFSIPNAANSESITKEAGALIGSIEAPPFPPKKSGTIAMPLGMGGIPPIIIPGKAISGFITSGVSSLLGSLDYNKILPGGLENFENLSETDIKNISANLVSGFSKKNKAPAISSVPPIPLKSRPQDMIEFSMQFLPVHPFSDIAFTILWNMIKSPPRVPITADAMDQFIKIQNAIFSRLPWPVVVMLGRWIINILNPLYNREDIPRWDRMSLNNPFFVVFLDEFLRSAADISGGFKFFVGPPSKGILYPLPDLEISLGFGTKIGGI